MSILGANNDVYPDCFFWRELREGLLAILGSFYSSTFLLDGVLNNNWSYSRLSSVAPNLSELACWRALVRLRSTGHSGWAQSLLFIGGLLTFWLKTAATEFFGCNGGVIYTWQTALSETFLEIGRVPFVDLLLYIGGWSRQLYWLKIYASMSFTC